MQGLPYPEARTWRKLRRIQRAALLDENPDMLRVVEAFRLQSEIVQGPKDLESDPVRARRLDAQLLGDDPDGHLLSADERQDRVEIAQTRLAVAARDDALDEASETNDDVPQPLQAALHDSPSLSGNFYIT